MQDGRIVESGTHESLTMPENRYHCQGRISYKEVCPLTNKFVHAAGLYYDMWKMQCMDEEQKYKPNKENLMAEAIISTCPNMIPNDIPPPSIDNNTHSRKPESSFVDEPATTQSSMMDTEKKSEDQKVTQRDEGTVAKVEESPRETSEEYPKDDDNTIKESQKETKAGNNGSSKKKKKPKTKKRKNSTVF